jgi:hypothetical protein
MIRRQTWYVLALLGLTSVGSSAVVRAQVPLADLTTAQIQQKLADDRSKDVIKKILDEGGVSVPLDPKAFTYSYEDDKPRLIWTYPPELSPEQAAKIADVLKKVLTESLVQIPGADNKSLITGEDGRKLVESLTPEMRKLREVPPAPPRNLPPRFTKLADLAIEVDEAGTVELGVSDESVATVRVSARSLDESLIPASGLTLTGSGAERLLRIAPAPGKSGEALVAVTATDAEGLACSETIAVFVLPIVSAIAVSGPTIGWTSVVYGSPNQQAAGSGSGTPSGGSGSGRGQAAAANYASAARSGCVDQGSQSSSTGGGSNSSVGGTGSSSSGGTVSLSSDIFAVRSFSTAQFVPRDELISGRTAQNAESLLSRGYEAFWAGNYPAAAELFAAAAHVSDDASAWTFLALSSMLTGDGQTARRAARYAAAKAQTSPTLERDISLSLVRVQGPLRRQLMDLQAVVSGDRIANAILAARPKLITRRVP